MTFKDFIDKIYELEKNGELTACEVTHLAHVLSISQYTLGMVEASGIYKGIIEKHNFNQTEQG